METIIAKVSLSYDSPVSTRQLQELQDKIYNLFDSEVNDGELAIEAECIDFEVEVERNDD